MNLDDLLKAVVENPKTLAIEGTGDADKDTYIFRRITFDKGNNVADQVAVCIIIKDKGSTDPANPETAFFKGSIPEYLQAAFTTEATFESQVVAKLEDPLTKEAIPYLEKFELTRSDDTHEIAELYAYTVQDQVATRTPYIAYLVNGEVVFRKLAQA